MTMARKIIHIHTIKTDNTKQVPTHHSLQLLAMNILLEEQIEIAAGCLIKILRFRQGKVTLNKLYSF